MAYRRKAQVLQSTKNELPAPIEYPSSNDSQIPTGRERCGQFQSTSCSRDASKNSPESSCNASKALTFLDAVAGCVVGISAQEKTEDRQMSLLSNVTCVLLVESVLSRSCDWIFGEGTSQLLCTAQQTWRKPGAVTVAPSILPAPQIPCPRHIGSNLTERF